MILADFIKPGSFARPATPATGVIVGRVVSLLSHPVAAGLNAEKHRKQKPLPPPVTGIAPVTWLSQGSEPNINTPVKTVAINGTSYQVSTTAVAGLTETDTSVTVAVVAEHPGSAYNLAAGYFTILEQPVTGVDAVTNAGNWITTPGADLESDGDLRLRIRDQFHTDAVYRAMIARQIALAPDQVHFEHNAPRGPGSANAYVLFDSGVVSQTYLDRINEYITTGENHGHGDDLLVLAMPEQSTAVSATLIYNNTLISTELTALQQRVEQMIRCAFRENSAFKVTRTQHHSRFSFSRLGEELHQGCTGLISITWGQTDVVTTLAVARLASLNLTWTPEAT